MAETGKYEKFRLLLRNGIGSRTKTEFSEATGIARETISRLLNRETIPQPARDTLERIARNIKNCSLNDLLESCGYPIITLEEYVADMEDSLVHGIKSIFHDPWTSIDRFAGTVEYFWIDDGRIITDKDADELEVTDPDNPAEYCRNIRLVWTFEDTEGECNMTLYYVKNRKGHVVLTSYKFVDNEETTDWEENKNKNEISDCLLKTRHILHSRIFVKDKVKEKATENLLRAIFGEECGETYVGHTVLGIGFNYNPKKEKNVAIFKDFVCNHAGSLCTSVEKNKIFQTVSTFEGSIDELDKYLESETTSRSVIIAEIMANETGLGYESYPDNDGHIVMYPCKNKREQMYPSKETLYDLSLYARELRIPEFGACYSEFREIKSAKRYKTSEFYLEFKDEN